MVNNNDLINLVNNKKPVELVQELKDYEIKKSPLSPAARAKVIKRNGSDYQSSRVSSEDIALMQMYGPGFWEGVWTATKKVGGVALAVSYYTPIAPVTATATLVAAGTALAIKEYGNESDKRIANDIIDVVGTAMDARDIGEATGDTYNNYRSVTRR